MKIEDPHTVITAIDNGVRFPEVLNITKNKYNKSIKTFIDLIKECSSSAQLLERIRSKDFDASTRMSLLKMFRRCVSPVLDTEATKKIQKVPTSSLVENYGDTFKSISVLKQQFSQMNPDTLAALAALVGEYDTRGQSGYHLTDQFFDWFEDRYSDQLVIQGPRGAGRDIELRDVFPDFSGSYPCDFIIRNKDDNKVLAVGFARYDSTRGGAQSDDRTGGNSNKVDKAMRFSETSGKCFKIIFLADGPGLSHKDTWEEACELDGSWNGDVRVTTLKTADERVTVDWLKS